MTGIVHVRCGSDIRDGLVEAGIPGDFIEFADPVCQGPVPAGLSEDDLHAARSRFIADTYGPGQPERISDVLDRIAGYDRIVLWFEHDIYDQSVLIRLLASLRDRPDLHDRLSMITTDRFRGIERFVGLGQLHPDQLAALWGTEKPVTTAQMDLAAGAWTAYRSGDPRALLPFAHADDGPLPYLPGALMRHSRELPWTDDGLSLTERLTLRAINAGADTPGLAFRDLYVEYEPQPFLGDLMYWPIVRGLAEAPTPALTPYTTPRDPIALTDFGRALLHGEADWIAVNGIDRWWGGTHLTGVPDWRWDEERETVVTG
jgi:hypothetical protein